MDVLSPPVTRQCARGAGPWPLPNLWLGVSVEDQDRIARVRDLLRNPCRDTMGLLRAFARSRPSRSAVPIDESHFDAIGGSHYGIDGRGRTVPVEGPAWRALDWVVAGGEIGAGARPMQPQWVRNLREQERHTGVPFLFRQWGEWAPALAWAAGQGMIRVGKRAAGRLLDGRSWDQIPVTAQAD